jgi:hypothetical protein
MAVGILGVVRKVSVNDKLIKVMWQVHSQRQKFEEKSKSDWAKGNSIHKELRVVDIITWKAKSKLGENLSEQSR